MRDGERTVDVILDRVVFGAPVTSYDLWRKMHLHGTSRRHSEHCGIDVIVAGSGLHAEQAAQTLVELAKEHYPPRGSKGTLNTTLAKKPYLKPTFAKKWFPIWFYDFLAKSGL